MHKFEGINEFSTDVTTEKTPWTHLEFTQGAGDNFNFAIVGDRTGRPDYGLFEKAIDQLNMLGPDFVMSVGDFIESFCVEDQSREFIQGEWERFEKLLKACEPPFFHVVGNHDIPSPDADWLGVHETMTALWKEQFGPTYYAFIRKGVLFLCLHTMEIEGNGISDAQLQWALETLKANADVRWTFVFMHVPPVWKTEAFGKLEAALYERNYTVFAGDLHQYTRYRRNGRNYYMLGMTGATTPEPAIPNRGPMFGEFQHLTWVSFRNGIPHVTLLPMDSIYEDDLVTVPKLTWLTAKYFRADKPLPEEELERLRAKGLSVDNSRFIWK